MTATECVTQELVILVDENDQQIGTAEKLEAHEKNLLHRAFSIFIFRKNPQVEILLQQRALHKYHSPGLWSNTCCSHPRPNETVLDAGNRRLREELGIEASLKDVGWFKYNAHFPNGLSEHEVDHVLIGEATDDLVVKPNPEEVNAVRWIKVSDLRTEVASHPDKFTPWLMEALELASHYQKPNAF